MPQLPILFPIAVVLLSTIAARASLSPVVLSFEADAFQLQDMRPGNPPAFSLGNSFSLGDPVSGHFAIDVATQLPLDPVSLPLTTRFTLFTEALRDLQISIGDYELTARRGEARLLDNNSTTDLIEFRFRDLSADPIDGLEVTEVLLSFFDPSGRVFGDFTLSAGIRNIDQFQPNLVKLQLGGPNAVNVDLVVSEIETSTVPEPTGLIMALSAGAFMTFRCRSGTGVSS